MKNPDEKNTQKCPRCLVRDLHPRRAKNPVSRRDNFTLICERCGAEEALVDAQLADWFTVLRDNAFKRRLAEQEKKRAQDHE